MFKRIPVSAGADCITTVHVVVQFNLSVSVTYCKTAMKLCSVRKDLPAAVTFRNFHGNAGKTICYNHYPCDFLDPFQNSRRIRTVSVHRKCTLCFHHPVIGCKLNLFFISGWFSRREISHGDVFHQTIHFHSDLDQELMPLNGFSRIRNCDGNVLAHCGAKGKIILPFCSASKLDTFGICYGYIIIGNKCFKSSGIL